MRSARLGRGTGDSGVRPSINVTPLVDVVLVLLIIFMVVIPQLDQDLPVDLPSIFNADPDVKTGEPFKVQIKKAGEYHFNGQPYDLESLVNILEAQHAAQPLKRLVLRADGALNYGDVRLLQNRLREVGFPGMAFGVNVKHRRDNAAASDGASAAVGG